MIWVTLRVSLRMVDLRLNWKRLGSNETFCLLVIRTFAANVDQTED